MDEKKIKRVKQKIIVAAIFVTLAIIAEIFIAMKVSFYPLVFTILIAILAVIAMYLFISGLLEFLEIKNRKRDEQFEDTMKSQKASYILHKKYFESLEERMNTLEKTATLPTEEIVTAQKGIAKVIISRSRENTEATLSSHEQIIEMLNEFEKQLNQTNADLVDQLHENNAGLVEQINENNAGLAQQINANNVNLAERISGNNPRQSENAVTAESIQQLIDKQQEILMNLKDMEIRMNDAILQNKQVVVESVSAYETPVVQGAAIPEEPVILEEEILPEDPVIPEEEIIPEEPVIPEEEIVPEEPVMMEEIVEEEKPPMPDLSDPNKKMSPDEIAALFANLA